jgi:tetratricopeptide (TPR) repeat protein
LTVTVPAEAQPGAGPVAEVHVPGYEVLGLLGRGGMGVVYRARHLGLNRVVALKMVLAGGHAEDAALRRFQAEAVAVARLAHPHIVQVHDFGRHGGVPFFTLELVGGGSLAARVAGQPQAPGDAARLTELLARAVHFAHERGVVHRDLKPANVLLVEGPETPLSRCTPKVTDFGLAKRLENQGGEATATGAVMGTPSYMAPEQARGQAKAVGPAADVYALGAVLYELLTGRPPFKAPTAAETLVQVAQDEPVPPSRLQPRLPRDLVTVCLKCLRKEPHRRYASALELAEDLRRFQAGESITARPVGVTERAAKWVRRRPAVAALLAAVLLLAAAGLIGIAWAYGEAVKGRAEARAAEARDNTLRVWDTAAGRELLVIKGHTAGVCGVAFAPDGSRLASVSWDRTARVWDVTTGRQLLCLDLQGVPSRAAGGVAFSPDGGRLAGVAPEGAVRVWDAVTGHELFVLRGTTGFVSGVAFSRDGSRLCGQGINGRQFAWDARTGRPCPDPTLPVLVEAGAVSPDGRLLACPQGDVLRVVGLALSGRERAYRRALTAPDPFRHDAEAERLAKEGQWFAAVFHLNRLSELCPDRTTLDRRRAALLAEAAVRGPAGPDVLAAHARACLAGGDRDGYRRACAALAALAAAGPEGPTLWASAARTCVLAPDAVEDLAPLLDHAERQARERKDYVALSIHGGLLLRAGKHREAVARLHEALKARDPIDTVQDELLLALAYHQLGDAEQARRWLDKAAAWRPWRRGRRRSGCSTPWRGCRPCTRPSSRPTRASASWAGKPGWSFGPFAARRRTP